MVSGCDDRRAASSAQNAGFGETEFLQSGACRIHISAAPSEHGQGAARITGLHQAAREILEDEDPPTAITATSDQLAVGAYQAAREFDRDFPNDIAVQRIRETQTGKAKPAPTTLDVELVIRSSCGCET